jgi:hypothetical protein
LSEPVQIAIIASIGPTLIGLLTAYFTYLNHKKLGDVEKATNGIKTELVAVTRKDSYAEGVKDQFENVGDHPSIVTQKTNANAQSVRDSQKANGISPSI